MSSPLPFRHASSLFLTHLFIWNLTLCDILTFCVSHNELNQLYKLQFQLFVLFVLDWIERRLKIQSSTDSWCSFFSCIMLHRNAFSNSTLAGFICSKTLRGPTLACVCCVFQSTVINKANIQNWPVFWWQDFIIKPRCLRPGDQSTMPDMLWTLPLPVTSPPGGPIMCCESCWTHNGSYWLSLLTWQLIKWGIGTLEEKSSPASSHNNTTLYFTLNELC